MEREGEAGMRQMWVLRKLSLFFHIFFGSRRNLHHLTENKIPGIIYLQGTISGKCLKTQE
jgi:hypothetical protein